MDRRRAFGWAAAASAVAVVILWLAWPEREAAPPPPPAPPPPVAQPKPEPAPPVEIEPEPEVALPVIDEDELRRHTVTLEDDEPLEERRAKVRLYGEARVKAVYDNEDLLGVQVTGVQPGSFWQEVGFRNGDLIVELNGDLVDDAEDSIAVINALSRDYVVILRVRGIDGEERMLEYRTPRS